MALALARTRLMCAKYPYYLLSDSPEGIEKEAELTGKIPPQYKTLSDIRKGFVYKRVPHVTLKSIANNPEIREGMTREEIDRAIAKYADTETLYDQPYEDGKRIRVTGPFTVESLSPHRALEMASELAHVDRALGPELAHVDRALGPEESAQNESAPTLAHVDRALGPEASAEGSAEKTAQNKSAPTSAQNKSAPTSAQNESAPTGTPTIDRFVPMIIENLRKAGVQNTKKQERLVFERLDSFAGTWLHAAGEYTEKGGRSKRVAVCIGPEHGTVGSELVKEAAKEALRGVGFDLLIVCGFAFDAHAAETALEFAPALAQLAQLAHVDRALGPELAHIGCALGPELAHIGCALGPEESAQNKSAPTLAYPEGSGRGDDFAVAEESREYGRLPVLLARMNPDLAMGDALLKKTGAANLFMVFGEPDITISTGKDGKLAVEVFGVDVYDPTTGQIRSSSTDDIACWFIDTEYNGESFFVRHAYFTGAGDPYDKLKRALRAEIDETAWASLYTTKSRPFDTPKSGKIAVKVINHYGDEVMKVYAVER